MNTYTFIWDYQGGTYIKQVRAKTPYKALIAWAHMLRPGEIPGLGARRLAHLVREIVMDAHDLYEPVELAGMTNAWCTGAPPGGIVNIVKTDLSR